MASVERVRSIAPVVTKVKLGEEPPDYVYWLTRPYEERLDALEQIRREYHGLQPGDEPRMEPVVRIVRQREAQQDG